MSYYSPKFHLTALVVAFFTAMLSTLAYAKSPEHSHSNYVHDSALEEILIDLASDTLSDQEIYMYLEVLKEQYPETYQMLVADGLLFDDLNLYQNKNSQQVNTNKSGVRTLLASTNHQDPCTNGMPETGDCFDDDMWFPQIIHPPLFDDSIISPDNPYPKDVRDVTY